MLLWILKATCEQRLPATLVWSEQSSYMEDVNKTSQTLHDISFVKVQFHEDGKWNDRLTLSDYERLIRGWNETWNVIKISTVSCRGTIAARNTREFHFQWQQEQCQIYRALCYFQHGKYQSSVSFKVPILQNSKRYGDAVKEIFTVFVFLLTERSAALQGECSKIRYSHRL